MRALAADQRRGAFRFTLGGMNDAQENRLAPTTKLNDGRNMPVVGLGTWPLDDGEVERVVSEALEMGYRHVDTAVRYGNEVGVGRALANSALQRDEYFVTTKLDGPFQGEDRAVAGLEDSLERLGLEFVDLLLIHWPLPAQDLYVSTWRTFERLQAEGKALSIGVSNFKPAHLQRLAKETSVVPAVNQIQLNPYVTREDHVPYHQEHGIATVSYSPIGKGGDLLEDPVIVEVARAHGKTPAQAILRWHLQLGYVPIPKSANVERLRQNLDVFDFELNDEEMRALSGLDNGSGVDADVKGH